MDSLRPLIAYTKWANEIWLDAVFTQASGDEYMTRTISHIFLAEQAWFQRIYAEEVRPDVFSTLAQDELRSMAARHGNRYNDLLGTDLSRVISYRKFNGEPMESTVLDILNHLVTHGSHHRGQLAVHASRNGLKPPDTAYITFTRSKKG